MDREGQIIRASIFNIIGNVLLAVVKGVAGHITGSIAITLDAVNSLADALSSIIAIIGTKLASKPANHEHPFGFGRMEYLTSIGIAALILSAGFSSFTEAIRSIIRPTTPTYTVGTLVVVGAAALVKYGLGWFLRHEGKRLNSGSLTGSGTDSLMDGCVSVATCVAGILYLEMGLQIESLLAAAIALLIIKSGIQLLMQTASKLLGERADPEIAARVERETRSVEEVRLASGLVLHDFGPDLLAGTIHVTVDGDMTVAEFDSVVRDVQEHVYRTCGVALLGVTPYPDVPEDDELSDEVRKVRAAVARIVWRHDHVVELRGLYIDPQTHTVRFDAIVEFGSRKIADQRAEIAEACAKACPGWTFEIRVLPDVGD